MSWLALLVALLEPDKPVLHAMLTGAKIADKQDQSIVLVLRHRLRHPLANDLAGITGVFF